MKKVGQRKGINKKANKTTTATELCAKLILKSLKSLNSDEEELVVDYLDSIGIETDLDTNTNELCMLLLKHKMKEDLNTDNMAALRPYANKILEKSEMEKNRDQDNKIAENLKKDRQSISKDLKKQTSLPGCVADTKLKSFLPYKIVVKTDLGIITKKNGSLQYRSAVSLPESLYSKIFLEHNQPIIELKSTDNTGEIAYARIEEAHNEDDIIYISPLTFNLLATKNMLTYIRLCKEMPIIDKIFFTYYGNKKDLDKDLPELIEKVPDIINAFSYASLGLVFTIDLNDKSVMLRVDKLLSADEQPIFSGILKFGDSDLPFEITSDL